MPHPRGVPLKNYETKNPVLRSRPTPRPTWKFLKHALISFGLICALGTAASTAAAFSTYSTRGKPGRVNIYKTLGWNDRHSYAWGLNVLRLEGPLVHRTRGTRRRRHLARRTQIICMQPFIYTFLPSNPALTGGDYWQQHARKARECVRVRRGQYVNFDNWDFRETWSGSSYSTLYKVSWWSGSGRTRLGARTYDLNAQGDYECETDRCRVLDVEGTAAIYIDL